MPWQSLAPLVVVGTMFNVAAGLVGGIHYLAYGVRSDASHCRPIRLHGSTSFPYLMFFLV